MSQPAAAFANEPLTHVLSGTRSALVGLAIGLVALGVLFHTEISVAIKTWIELTAYNHCFLVIPIAIYLIWDRQSSLRGLTAAPLPVAGLLALPFGLVWLASERLGIMEGRQLAALSMAEVLFFAMFGWRLWKALLGPLLYLYFLVPFGEFLTPRLQDLTAWFTRHGLDILGIPAYVDGYIIEIREGTFFVAEACAGLRFLIASIAFGVLYSLLMYRSPLRRTLFILASIVVPIIANGFRAMGIVVLGHVLGSAEAAAADHVLYGWIFFSLVILMLIVLGLPFRQDERPVEATGSPMSPEPGAARMGLIAGVVLAVLAAVGPGIVLGLNHAAAMPDIAMKPLDLAPVCVDEGSPAAPRGDTGRAIVQRMNCGGTIITVTTEVFSPRTTAGPVNAERRRLTRVPNADDISETAATAPSGSPLPGWRFVRSNEPAFVSAVGLWIDGQPTSPGMAMRLHMARTSLTGDTAAPVLIVITPVVDWAQTNPWQRQELQRQLSVLLDSRPDIGKQVQELTKAKQ